MRYGTIVLSTLASFALASCGKTPNMATRTVDNVERITMRGEGQYDLFVSKPGSNVLEEKHITIRRDRRVFITDAPAGKPSWLVITYDKNIQPPYGNIYMVEFHIHSAKDMGTASYMEGGKSKYEVRPTDIDNK